MLGRSPHHMGVTSYNELILANNSKTEFCSFSYNYNSKACWQKKVLPEQVIFGTFEQDLMKLLPVLKFG